MECSQGPWPASYCLLLLSCSGQQATGDSILTEPRVSTRWQQSSCLSCAAKAKSLDAGVCGRNKFITHRWFPGVLSLRASVSPSLGDEANNRLQFLRL